MEIKNKTWVEGGDAVYGDNPFKEALYALEDELITLDSKDGKFIPQDRMLKVMIAYEKFLKDYFSQQKQEMVEDVEKYAGKVFGFEIIILKDKYDKRYIAGFGDGKKYLKGEVFKLLVPNKTQLNKKMKTNEEIIKKFEKRFPEREYSFMKHELKTGAKDENANIELKAFLSVYYEQQKQEIEKKAKSN